MQNLLRLSYEKILLLASVNLRDDYPIKLDMAAYGHIGSWMTQVAARPAVAAALAAEGLK
ncbi:hypothetical protein HJW82_11965 [Klebsiella pneumoniae]|nr:hypothetical protein HJW82_11965 [Klebsiella pneumoniae]